MNAQAIRFFLIALLCITAGCASIVPPSGGPKDVTPPKLVSISPADSQLNARIGKIRMQFDEYITVSDASKEVEISPILSIPPTLVGLNKHVIVHIPDTLLEDNTTYRISFGKAIKDLHENNPFPHYTYTFSTGNYFDSLQISGTVLNAATGLPDTSIYVLLYSASRSDSAIVREKPKYVGKVNANGSYSVKGLPGRKFRVYAIKDANENLIYDGPGEMVGFYEGIVTPGDSSASKPIDIRVFPEVIDSNLAKKLDTTSASSGLRSGIKKSKKELERERQNFSYSVSADTSNIAHRTQDINLPVDVAFSRVPVLSDNRIAMTYDSSGTPVETPITIYFDTTKKPDSTRNIAHVKPANSWRENTIYTLKLMKGFAKDTGGVEAMPSRYTFRTMRDEDYGKILVHLPTKYNSTKYILMVMADKDTVYQKPVTDTMVQLVRLKPAKYTFRIIVDENGNGQWDTGDLFAKKQPEIVIPYNGSINLRANWEHTIDYDAPPPAPKNAPKNDNSLPHK